MITAWQLHKSWFPDSREPMFKWAVRLLPALLFTHAGSAFAFMGEIWSYTLTFWILPFFFVLPGIFLARKMSFSSAMPTSWNAFTGAFGRILFCFLVYVVLVGLAVSFFQTPLTDRVIQLVVWNLAAEEDSPLTLWILNYGPAWLGYFCFLSGSIFQTALSGFLAHTLLEVREAENLLSRIRHQYAEPK
jgi:hypothetical protein